MDQPRPQQTRPSPTTDRAKAMAALQRALDRRDNGGATGHQ